MVTAYGRKLLNVSHPLYTSLCHVLSLWLHACLVLELRVHALLLVSAVDDI